MRRWIFLFLLVFCAAFVVNCSNSGNFTQPIAYSHKKHVEEAGLSCIDCHVRATTHRKASIPNIEVCVECHEEAMTESKEEAKVVAYIEKKEQIPWVQVHRVPDYAYFSHRRHVTIGKLDCSKCHGNVAEKTVPFVRPAVTINMKFCMKCHKRKQANTDCAACHR
jgi:ribosomal protein L32